MTEITDLSETDSANTVISTYPVDGNIANMSSTDNVFQAILGLLKRSLKSSIWRLRDSTDQTKLLAFDLSGQGTGTTRTVKMADRDINLQAVAARVGSSAINYTVALSDIGGRILIDASGGSRVVSLPAATTAGSGFPIVIKKADSSVNTVTIDASGSETIDGALTKVIRLQNQSIALVCDGTNWQAMSEGAIFETGSNANGEYIRYANGWQTCTKELTPAVSCDQPAGNIFMSVSINAGSLPASFASVPKVSATGTSGSGNGWTLMTAIQTASNWGTYRHANYSSDANTGGKIYLIAEGKWF